MGFRVQQIDHVELFVPSRREAAAWYEQVLGLEVVNPYRGWADDPLGPLMISPDGGDTKLALFRRRTEWSLGSGTGATGFHRTAFRVDGAGFLAFRRLLDAHEIRNHEGERVRPNDLVDHDLAFSYYLCDPWGHRLEVTTYDHEPVRTAVGGSS